MPIINFSASPSVLTESDNTLLTFTFTSDTPLPPEGIQVAIDSLIPESLAQLDLFDFNITGGNTPVGNFDFSGFSFTMTAQTATISAPIFQDEIIEVPQNVTYTLLPGVGYTLGTNIRSTVTFRDTLLIPITDNLPPVARSDVYSVNDAANFLNVRPEEGVLKNDIDPNENPLTAKLFTAPKNGSLMLNSNGSFVYTPRSGFAGIDQFTYVANDGTADSQPALVEIDVQPTLSPTVTLRLTVTPSQIKEEAGQFFLFTLQLSESPPSQGIPVVIKEGFFPDALVSDLRRDFELVKVTTDGIAPGFNYTYFRIPQPGLIPDDFISEFRFTMTAQTASFQLPVLVDSTIEPNKEFYFQLPNSRYYTSSSGNTQIVVKLEDINALPVANPDNYGIFSGDTRTVVAGDGVLRNDRDQNSEPLTARLVTEPKNGKLIFNADGSFRYSSNPGFKGTDQFTYVANDGKGDSNPAIVTLTVAPDSNTIIGTDGNDILENSNKIFYGLEGNDSISNLAGSSQQYGGSGNDVLSGSFDTDLLSGGDGNDFLFANGGNDFISGGDGNDYIFGESGSTIIDAGNGDDLVIGGIGPDTINGGNGKDVIVGNGGDDWIVGGAGNDVIYLGIGDNRIDGGLGDDTIWLGDGKDLVILRRGNGIDIINEFKLGKTQFGLANRLTFADLSFLQGNGFTRIFAGGDVLAQVNSITASNLNVVTNFIAI
jgi:Bacterial Ig domain/RTX calcium-binding nonapeptide repeat (4 copies)